MKRKPGRPKSRHPQSVILKFRATRGLAQRIRALSRLYADGDLSAWLRHAAVNADRKFLK